MPVLNLSLEKGIFVGDPKIDRVTPLLKVGHKKEIVNYRPVSILPCIFFENTRKNDVQ